MLDIFGRLMVNSGMQLHQGHAGALNLVEEEFAGHPDVVETWKITPLDWEGNFHQKNISSLRRSSQKA